jgi:hypothetical protein
VDGWAVPNCYLWIALVSGGTTSDAERSTAESTTVATEKRLGRALRGSTVSSPHARLDRFCTVHLHFRLSCDAGAPVADTR